jgi:hypothetical protein
MSHTTDDLRPLDARAFGARVEAHRREWHVYGHRLNLPATLSAGVGTR